MAHWPPIGRDDLVQAADSDGFPGVLPQLVRRLIGETADGLTELDMPGEGGVAVGGFDGVVTANRATVEVPRGTSVWELSVEKSTRSKADKDYAKRLAAPGARPPTDITYVQLILRPWTKASAWAEERSKDDRWKQVRALNLDAVRGWLDQAPATAVWLAERLGKAVPGTRLADDWFERTWLPSTKLPLSTEIVLAGREEPADTLLSHLTEGRPVVTIAGDVGTDEFRAFVAAVIERTEGPQREALRARTLFVDDAPALARLTALPQPLVLVLADARLAASAPVGGPHQIVVFSPSGGNADVEVGRVDSRAVAGLLAAAGEPDERADDLGALARRSLSALRRNLAVHPATLRPRWADGPDVVRRRMLLLGGWHGTDTADRALVERITGRPWNDAQDAALALAAATDIPMLGRLNESWHAVSPSDAWLLLQPHMTRDDLIELHTAAIEVLTEPDPLHGLSSTEALRAQMDGRRRRYSSTLRHGLARSLALLGSTPGPVPATGTTTGAEHARRTVRDVLKTASSDATYAVWTGLRPVLGELAEAAPEEFLHAMREGLRGASPVHARMFTDGDGDGTGLMGPSAGHSEFLWALETLAWSSEYFDDAVDVLAALADFDPGGRYSNRPARSLTDIFSCQHPTTSADERQRELALRRLLRNRPDVATALLVALIPDGNYLQMTHRGPRFRDWKHEPVMTRTDVIRNARAVGELLLKIVTDDRAALLATIGKVDHLTPEHRRALCEILSALGESLTDETERAELSEALRAVAARHREYADTGWALPADEIAPIEDAAAALAPRDPVHRHGWLFAEYRVNIGDLSRRDDHEAYDSRMQELRADAVVEVLAARGLGGIEALAAGTPSPNLVGVALADAAPALDADMLGWLEQDAPRPDVAYAYLARRMPLADPQTVDELLAAADSPSVKAAVLRAAGDPPSTWARLDELGDDVAQAYWKGFSIYGLGDFQAVDQAARGLMSVGRHAALLGLIPLYTMHVDTPEGAELAATACEALLADGGPDPELRALSGHDFRTIVALMHRHRDVLDPRRLVNIEWRLFPALGFQPDAPALHEALSNDPAFFVDILELVFPADQDATYSTLTALAGTDDDGDGLVDAARGSDDIGQHGDPTDVDGTKSVRDQDAQAVHREIARRAYEVLHSWRRVPGAGPNGVIDAQRLDSWVDEGRRLLTEHGRLAHGDRRIGEVLAHALPDPDGTTPPRAVRDLLERIDSDELDCGLGLGIGNRRGVTSRGAFDGGDQERNLAATFREQADGAALWPRARRLLRRIAESYEQGARQHDEEAERCRRGLDG